MRCCMIIPNIMIVVGALLIGIGGIIATSGWNKRTVVHQRDGIIRSVAAEMMMNMSIIEDSKFTETDDKKLSKYKVFPKMQTAALAGALASGLFTGEKDRVFLSRAASLNENLLEFNNRLILTQNIMNESPNRIYEFRKGIRDGKTRKSVGVQLIKLMELLLSDYGIKADDTFFVNLDD